MTKQEFLDIEANNDETKIIQQLLLSLNKTKISQLRRAIQELDRALYKTWMKEKPLNDLFTYLQVAESYLHNEKKEENEV